MTLVVFTADGAQQIVASLIATQDNIVSAILPCRQQPGVKAAIRQVLGGRSGHEGKAQSQAAEPERELHVLGAHEAAIESPRAQQMPPAHGSVAGVELPRSGTEVPLLHERVLLDQRPHLPPDPG